jgi:hypothetical protein
MNQTDSLATHEHAHPHFRSLLRHFADLRDGTHGDAVTRAEKEALFAASVELLDPPARQALTELNDDLLRGTGRIRAAGPTRTPDGGVSALWALSWPRQRAVAVDPVTIRAHYGLGFHHPHLGGGTVGEWPLNVFDAAQAGDELPILRAIAAAELHNIVYRRDWRIVPVIAET